MSKLTDLDKKRALCLRKKGMSLNQVHIKTGIAKSTLSTWFKSVKLSELQKNTLKLRQMNSLHNARKKAVLWHQNQKRIRKQSSKHIAHGHIKNGALFSKDVQRLALALLYHGEGSKGDTTSLGSSDKNILKFFIQSIEDIFQFNRIKMRFYIHARLDQDADSLINYWSKELSISRNQFKKPIYDKRTMNKPTYNGYHGVCVAYVGRVDIQRELLYLSELYCQKIWELRA